MSKVQVVKQQQEKNVIAERDLLYECASTFVLKLHTTYQSADELFLLMELIQGGELWQYIYEKKHLLLRTSLGGLATPTAQFYAVVYGVQFQLPSLNIGAGMCHISSALCAQQGCCVSRLETRKFVDGFSGVHQDD